MFSRKIIAMQTDWGGEYQKLNTFFQRIGISHHVSCPYAHQQNGSTERKHRHIVEVGLSLLAHASMPLKFWDEAFITATYLINRLLSKVIDNQTPLERLLHQKLDYSMLRTFGCACWPNLRPYNTRKLQFRSKRCVFLGYNNIHKGFKCLDVGEGRVYISRDVIFDESVFLFHELHPNVGARLREEVLLLPSADQNSGDECANDSIMIDSSASHKDPTVVFGDQEQNSASTDENSEQMQHYFMQGGTCLACNPKLIWAPDPRLMRLWQWQGILRLSRRRRQQGPPNPTQSLRPSLCLRHLAATPRQHRTCPLLLRHLEPRRRLPGHASRQLPGRGHSILLGSQCVWTFYGHNIWRQHGAWIRCARHKIFCGSRIISTSYTSCYKVTTWYS
jgi:hypothetical protein